MPEGWGQHADLLSGQYEFIENTGDEILEATKELEKIVKTKKKPTQSFLNKKLISYYPKKPDLYIKHRGIISEYFLKKHRDLVK